MSDLLANCKYISLRDCEVRDGFYQYSFTESTYRAEYKISPFRPECYGGIFYSLIYYIGEKHNVKIVHYGEANLLPFYGLNSHECRFRSYRESEVLKEYNFDSHNITADYTIMEKIQRENSEIIKKDRDIHFAYRTFFYKNFESLCRMIAELNGCDLAEIFASIDYDEALEFTKNKWNNSPVYLVENSRQIHQELSEEYGSKKFWFCSHARTAFVEFEKEFYRRYPELVIEDSMLDRLYPVYGKIAKTDVDAILSTQILFSMYGTKFITSGGATNLFYNIPYIELAHACYWDHWIRELYELKDYFQNKFYGTKPIRFNAGGLMNNIDRYPIKNFPEPTHERIPSYAKKIEYGTSDVMVYAGEVFRCLREHQNEEIEKIVKAF